MTVVRRTPWGIRMKNCIFRLTGIGVAMLLGGISTVCAQNQTPDVSTILPEDSLPLRITIEQADFSLPALVQGPSIPTLSQWGLLVLALFVGVVGLALHGTSSVKI